MVVVRRGMGVFGRRGRKDWVGKIGKEGITGKGRLGCRKGMVKGWYWGTDWIQKIGHGTRVASLQLHAT
jgi:hypothetical protein